MANKQLCDEYKKLCSRGLNKCLKNTGHTTPACNELCMQNSRSQHISMTTKHHIHIQSHNFPQRMANLQSLCTSNSEMVICKRPSLYFN